MTPSSRHALIIEDEMLTGLTMQMALVEVGFDSFAFASTAAQAMEQATLRRPDLVTADIGLLHGDGVEACGAIQRALGPLPVIYVTGQIERVAGDGRLTVVAKPFSVSDIAAACAHVRPADDWA